MHDISPEPVPAAPPAPAKRGRTIVITSGKGGVGKTTTTANVGVALAATGARVALVDADVGLRNLDIVLGLEARVRHHVLDVLEGNAELDDALREKITAAIRKGASPRHVPDAIVGVPGIPRTITGKRLEIPIKRILLGAKPADVVSESAVDKPELLAVFAEHAQT